MDSRHQRPQRKTLQWQLAQEQGQQSPQHGPSAASVQPDPKSNPQEDLQTQDWVCEPPEPRRPGSRWNVSIDERRRLAMMHARKLDMARAPSRDPLGLHLPGQFTVPSPTTQPETTVGPLQDITQMVTELVSEGVEKDVLLPHPLRSTTCPNDFQHFLDQDIPLWENENLETNTSRSPPF